MRYMVSVSYVDVIGTIWMPAITCAMRYELDSYQLDNIKAEFRFDGMSKAISWRDAVDGWLSKNAGDFQSIEDFSASLEIDGKTIDVPWTSDESEMTYNDCMFGDEG